MMTMRNILWWSVACLAACFTVAACAKTTSSGGSSETHFLALCNASCDEGFSCLCGVCTESCDDGSACTELHEAATCEVTSDGCGMGRACDVECSDDGDCSALGDAYACDDAGRCRAPVADPMGNASGDGGSGGTGGSSGTSGDGGGGGDGDGDGDGDPPCTIEGVLTHLLGDPAVDACDAEGASPADRASCAQQHVDQEEPFALIWDLQGRDSILRTGFVGVSHANGYYVAKLYYDSLGFVVEQSAGQPLMTSWYTCDSFSLSGSCESLDECFQCLTTHGAVCGCGEDTIFGECSGFTPAADCKGSWCLIDGVCYPDRASTEDGCCDCDDGTASCIEPEWCPGWTTIGKRCDPAGGDGCAAGLDCRADIQGERGVCTRPCNFGCPTGFECVTDIPGADGGPLGEALCLRPCESHGDCSVGDVSLGSLCTALDEDASSAFCL